MSMLPDFSYEIPLWDKGMTAIGIDEVGRGAFAGPVAVGGVIFSPNLSRREIDHLLSLGINDSKKITAKKREELSVQIKSLSAAWHISFITVGRINEAGIGKATFDGMRQVADTLKLKTRNPYLLIDAFEIPEVLIPQKGIIRGDSLSISIAAASIIAKVERDRLMAELGKKYPHYEWEKNKGYGTLIHRKAIAKYGQISHHRVDFCRKIVPGLLF